MKFKDVVIKIVSDNPEGITPPEIQEKIESDYPEFYGTESHMRNVEKGHYRDLHHALKAQVYGLVRQNSDFLCNKAVKPFLVLLANNQLGEVQLESESEYEDYESFSGKIYILRTGVFTDTGDEIFKIGQTTQSIEKRISQLYTTGVPFQFSVYKVYEVNEHIELESVLHKLLSRYRLNKSREFFSEKALPFVDQIVELHNQIQSC